MAALRVVLDTNVLVSGLAYPGSVPGRIVAAWREGGLDVVLSRYFLDEMVRVLPRWPRVRLSAAEIRDLADSFMFLADVVEPSDAQDEHLRDPADQRVSEILCERHTMMLPRSMYATQEEDAGCDAGH